MTTWLVLCAYGAQELSGLTVRQLRGRRRRLALTNLGVVRTPLAVLATRAPG